MNFPEASTQAVYVDRIFLVLCVLAGCVLLILLGLIVGFSFAFRRGSKTPRPPLAPIVAREVEIGWTVATLFAFLFIFWFAASAQLSGLAAPAHSLEIHVVAKQWMWKFQHPSGAREIDELHVPAHTPVRLVMISQDVIHSFYVPAFRVKQDVLPGRYTQVWFEATAPGTYRLQCAEFCGMDHAAMLGRVVVLAPAQYATWIERQPDIAGPSTSGRALFVRLGCSACHEGAGGVRAPSLAGLAGSHVLLADGRTITADEAYLRDSILLPQRDVAAGYRPVMPSYQGAVSEEDVNALVAYIQALPSEHTP